MRLSTQALIDGLWVMGWPTSHVMGARPLTEGQKKLVGRAVTLRFVPQRPDIAASKPAGMESPEYEAFEQTGPNECVVMESVGPWESVGGAIGCRSRVRDRAERRARGARARERARERAAEVRGVRHDESRSARGNRSRRGRRVAMCGRDVRLKLKP